jgi:hypothetical protein
MDYSKSFMYVISNFDKTQIGVTTTVYDINFGGFSEPYDNYSCEVISMAVVGGITTSQSYYIFVAENLASDGYFCTNKLINKETIMAIVPLNALQDAYIQSDGGNIRFTVKNCRVPKQVRFKFLKQDFTEAGLGDINSGGETNWILTLKMTPIIN